MRAHLRPLVLATIALTSVASCASTKTAKSFVAPGFSKTTVKKVLVLGVSGNPLLRRFYEDAFAVELEKRGYEAVSGYLWAPDATPLDKDALLARMKAAHVTNVLVTRVISKKDVVTSGASALAAGQEGYGGYGPASYGSWSTYYAAGYATASDPGYSTVNDIVTFETNFYDAAKEPDTLVWSGASSTWKDQPRSTKKLDGIISAIVHRMRAARVL